MKSLSFLILIILDFNTKATDGVYYPYYNHVANLLMAIGGVVGLLSAMRVYKEWQVGNGSLYEGASRIFFGALLLLISGGVIKLIALGTFF